jgi:hypothetical protein
MSNEKQMKPSEQLRQLKETMPIKCPLAIEEVISSLARCELVHDNCEDAIEKYFAKESCNVLQDLGAQLLTLASHPNIKKIVDTAPNGLQEDIL